MYEVPKPHHEWVEAFLEVREPRVEPGTWFSAFSAAARDAREATGRDLQTGVVGDPTRSGNWLGTLGYLVLLDQIGECFGPVAAVRMPIHKADLVKALTHFGPGLSDDEILAIYALRCAFAHDYGLVNVGQGPLAGRLNHAFLLTNKPGAKLVTPPSLPWNGDLGRAQTMRTTVDVRAVGDLVEDLIRSLQAGNAAGKVQVILGDGVNELMARFSMTLYTDE